MILLQDLVIFIITFLLAIIFGGVKFAFYRFCIKWTTVKNLKTVL